MRSARYSFLAFALTLLSLRGQIVLNPPRDLATFTSDVELVNVLCVVRDKTGTYSKDLAKADFVILENGKPQNIKLFAKETDAPLRVALLIDTSGSVAMVLDEEKEAARLFFQNVIRRGDMALLGSFASRTVIWQELTGNKRFLEDAIERTGDYVAEGKLKSSQRGGGTVLFDAVNMVALRKLKTIRGRKVMVLLTDGLDVGSITTAEAAYKEALASDTVIYAIHYTPDTESHDKDTGLKALRKLTEPTGGKTFYVDAKHPLKEAFQAIEDDMRNQYALGYKPLNEATDGSFRKLEVKIKQPGLKAQTRSGYFAIRK